MLFNRRTVFIALALGSISEARLPSSIRRGARADRPSRHLKEAMESIGCGKKDGESDASCSPTVTPTLSPSISQGPSLAPTKSARPSTVPSASPSFDAGSIINNSPSSPRIISPVASPVVSPCIPVAECDICGISGNSGKGGKGNKGSKEGREDEAQATAQVTEGKGGKGGKSGNDKGGKSGNAKRRSSRQLKTRPSELSLQYTSGIGETSELQGNRATCTERLDNPYPGILLVGVDGAVLSNESVKDIFDNEDRLKIQSGEIFSIMAQDGGDLGAVTEFQMKMGGAKEGENNSVENCEIHTSCSVPLQFGDQIGPFTIVGGPEGCAERNFCEEA